MESVPDTLPSKGVFVLGRRPGLDGLRGLAILSILLFHSGCPWWRGGFVGVDLFFALSGFLISSILLADYRGLGHVSYGRFYIRRALRLLPAMLTFLVAFALMSIAKSTDPYHSLGDCLIVLCYMANWTRAFGTGRPDRLGHTWSLSIEEQFYLLWPVTLETILRTCKTYRRSVQVLAIVILGVWLLRAAMLASGAHPLRIYSGLDTRADALLVGCLLAVSASYGAIRAGRLGRRSEGLLARAARWDRGHRDGRDLGRSEISGLGSPSGGVTVDLRDPRGIGDSRRWPSSAIPLARGGRPHFLWDIPLALSHHGHTATPAIDMDSRACRRMDYPS